MGVIDLSVSICALISFGGDARMRWSKSIRWINALMVSGVMVGCHTPKEVRYLGDADLQYYRNNALEIDYPNVDQETPAGVVHSVRPRTVKDEDEITAW